MHKSNKEPSQTCSPFPKKLKQLNELKKDVYLQKSIFETLSAYIWKYKIMAAITQAPSLSVLSTSVEDHAKRA